MSTRQQPSRRAVVRGAAWSVPVVVVATAAPAHAASGSAPTITAVIPSSGGTAGGTSITITGTGFASASDVAVGGTLASFVVVDSTTITATTPPHVAGTVDVVVVTASGSATLAGGFTYLLPPTVINLIPRTGPVTGGTRVAVVGSGFVPGDTTVGFGGVTVPASLVTVVRSSQLNVATPAHAAGVVSVTVTTSAGTATFIDGFTYISPA